MKEAQTTTATDTSGRSRCNGKSTRAGSPGAGFTLEEFGVTAASCVGVEGVEAVGADDATLVRAGEVVAAAGAGE